MLALVHAIFGLKWKPSVISLSRYVLSHCKSELIVSWNSWLTSLLRLYRRSWFLAQPTWEGETKRQQSKQLQFHKINTKKKNICRTPTIWRQSNLPSNISQFVPWSKLSNLSALHWTLPIPKPRKRLKCIHSQINSSKHIKINWFSDCKWSQHYSKFPSTIPHLRE